MATVALGLVGYYQFIRGYPLGPELKERLDSLSWPDDSVEIKEMNWGPVAIVQDFQANPTVYDRIVLIAAVQRGGKPTGTVTCRQWVGGEIEILAVQDRIFEAVTGVISLDNLLVIGEHFGIWPNELIVIEAELPNESVGNLVLRELGQDAATGQTSIVGDNPMAESDLHIVQEIAALADLAVRGGVAALPEVRPLSVKDLNPLADVCHNQLIEDAYLQSRPT